ncbi:MAG TPA: YceD family protein, partial [Sphingomicrobium sp.]
VDEPFDLVFLPEPRSGGDEEIELAEGDLDTVFHDGSAIDLGGAIADTLALAIDPYPRSAGADAALKEAGVLTEEEASPFAALAALKEKLGK